METSGGQLLDSNQLIDLRTYPCSQRPARASDQRGSNPYSALESSEIPLESSIEIGGEDRDRTDDLLRAKQLLLPTELLPQ